MTNPHPLMETDCRPNREEVTAPEAAAFIANPDAPQAEPTQEQLWLEEDARWFAEIARGEVCPPGQPAEPWPEEEEDTAE